MNVGSSRLLKKGDRLRTDRVSTAKNDGREAPVPFFNRLLAYKLVLRVESAGLSEVGFRSLVLPEFRQRTSHQKVG
jgi:hypothetical protein